MNNIKSTHLQIDLDVVARNVRAIRELIGEKIEFMAVVKANAYGHDAVEISRVALKNGSTRLAVADVKEAITLREAGIKAPILVLGITSEREVEPLFLYDLTGGVSDLQVIKKISNYALRYNKTGKIHINIDTGMARLGVLSSEALNFIKEVGKKKSIEIEGIFTAFSSADDENKTTTYQQFDKFNRILDGVRREKIHIPLKHIANSAIILNFPSMWLDMVRPGIALYGLFPSNHTKKAIKLKPVSEFKTKIVFIRKMPPENSVSYGETYITSKNSLIATLPLGYADGYPRALSNQGEVLIRGKRAPIVGRVCMNHCMVDVTHIPEAKLEDEVVLWGKQKGETIFIEEIAEKIGTIVYEVATMVDRARVPKTFIKDGKRLTSLENSSGGK